MLGIRYRTWTKMGLLMTSAMIWATISYAATPEILILFDQSGSMQRYNTRELSMMWISSVIRNFDAPNKITLVGFDYEPHTHLSTVIHDEAALSPLSSTLNNIQLSGMATDLEIPLRYIQQKSDEKSVKMVLLITDGEPDVWDKDTGFLSPRILTDQRYADLNEQYHALKATQISEEGLYQRLSEPYRQRNLELTEKALLNLQNKIGNKLVIWDISGKSERLKQWADSLKGHHMPLDTESQEPLEDSMEEVLEATLDTTKTLMEEPEQTLEPESAETTNSLATTPATGIIPPQPPAAEPEPNSDWFRNYVYLFILFIVVTSILLLMLFRRKSVEVLEKEETLLDRDEILDYIEQRIKSAKEDTEEFVSEVFEKATEGLGDNKRLSLRVPLPPGTVIVHWTDRDGASQSASAVDISMHGILIDTPRCDTGAIDSVEVPKKQLSLGVARSLIKRRDSEKFVITLLEFEREVEDKMAWIELQTRINEED